MPLVVNDNPVSRGCLCKYVPPKVPRSQSQAERIECGEHVGYDLVKNVLELGIQQWNYAVKLVKEKVQNPQALLKHLDAAASDMQNEKEVSRIAEEFQNRSSSLLKEIVLKPTDGSFMKLVNISLLCMLMTLYSY